MNSYIIKVKQLVKSFTQGSDLKARFALGSAWTLVGFAGNLFIRMASSLILTRIFVPEVFGLMAIVFAIMMGLELLSDVGIGASIVQNPRGEEPDFLKTAWTIQVIRGFILWGVLFLIADKMASLYNEPLLASILPVLGIGTMAKSFSSTSRQLYVKRVIVDKPIKLELTTQLVGLIIIIILALTYKNVWAFVIGGISSTIFYSVGSYVYMRGGIVGFKLDKSAVLEIIHFGKWILLATMLGYLVGQGDRLILGTLIDKNELGLYNLAVMFAQLSLSFMGALVGKVLMPGISEVAKKDKAELSNKFNKIRKSVIVGLLPLILFTAIFGQLLIDSLYEKPYHGAGWMLQVLSVGMIFQIICQSIIPIFIAVGDSYRHMLSIVFSAILFVGLMVSGYYFGGLKGLVIGIASASVLWLPMVYFLARKHVKLYYKQDLKFISISLILVAVGWSLTGIKAI